MRVENGRGWETGRTSDDDGDGPLVPVDVTLVRLLYHIPSPKVVEGYKDVRRRKRSLSQDKGSIVDPNTPKNTRGTFRENRR